VFRLNFLFQLGLLLYQNRLFTGRGFPRAEMSFSTIKSKEYIVMTAAHVHISLPQPMQLKAGQYINLWIPAVSPWLWAQAHPFTVTSWSKGPWNTIELLMQPCCGLSTDLAHYTTVARETLVSFCALFTGPHGMSEDVRHYESILVIISRFGIAAAIPYMKKTIYSYYTQTIKAHQLHLV
jgi:NAD(P)H-flavin reductase